MTISRYFVWLYVALFFLLPLRQAYAGAQQYEELSVSVRTVLSQAISDQIAPESAFDSDIHRYHWITSMSARLKTWINDEQFRRTFLKTLHYEATRAGLDPQLVLAVVTVESRFRKYAVSGSGARGYMQVMPFWVKLIGRPEDNLFHLRTSLRYGCVILRHYLDIEHGNVSRALGRYNGSLGKPEYPDLVTAKLNQFWIYQQPY